jgi:hypothetical protein
MLEQHAIIDANALASWLAREGGDVRWTVDGEATLEAQLDLPCTGSDLGDAVRKHGGELLVLVPHHGPVVTGEKNATDPSRLAVRDDHGRRVFQLAWKSDPTRPWVVAEDLDVDSAVAASR